MARFEYRELDTPAAEEPVGSYEESIRLTRKVCEGRLDLAAGARPENCNLQAERAGGFRQIPRRSFGSGSICRIDQHGNASGLGHNLLQKPEPFGGEVGQEKLIPVALPPGRLRLATRPIFTGSAPVTKTRGIVAVAALAAIVAAVLCGVTMTATRRRTSSAASAGRRSL
jgi:hypothetical protein